jgi:hypothetical protein
MYNEKQAMKNNSYIRKPFSCLFPSPSLEFKPQGGTRESPATHLPVLGTEVK